MKIGDKVKIHQTVGVGIGHGVLEYTEGQEIVVDAENMNPLGRLINSGVKITVIEEKKPAKAEKSKE